MKIGTFYTPRPGKPPRKSHISAYSLWYNSEQTGCVEYEIDSMYGTDAKKEATRKRLELEESRWTT